MPTKDVIIEKDSELPHELRSLLSSFFSPDQLDKVAKNGARIRVTLTTPWPKTAKKKKPKVVIDDALIRKIQEAAASAEELEAVVGQLSGPQVQEVGERLDISIGKTGRVESLRSQLISSLRSEAVWRGISGQEKKDEEPYSSKRTPPDSE